MNSSGFAVRHLLSYPPFASFPVFSSFPLPSAFIYHFALHHPSLRLLSVSAPIFPNLPSHPLPCARRKRFWGVSRVSKKCVSADNAVGCSDFAVFPCPGLLRTSGTACGVRTIRVPRISFPPLKLQSVRRSGTARPESGSRDLPAGLLVMAALATLLHKIPSGPVHPVA